MSGRRIVRSACFAAAAALAAVLCVEPAWACQACFGADDGPMIDGARAGGWTLIGLVVFMQVAFATFFLILRRRFRLAAAASAGGDGRAAHS